MSHAATFSTPWLEKLERFLDLSVLRHGVISSNLANVDTPGYRTRDINFRAELEAANGPLAEAVFSPALRTVQGLTERPDGNNVSLERETLLLARTQLGFNVGIQVLRAEFKRLSVAINEGSKP